MTTLSPRPPATESKTEPSIPRGAVRATIWFTILAPLLFFICAVQYSALVFPFWDHCELIQLFAKIHDHSFQLADLWAPHNHSRPLTYRAVLLLNGLATGWDIRSEYIYLMASVIGAFLLQIVALRRVCEGARERCLVLGALVSIFSFSPAGHNNHWWSMMIQLDFTHFFITAAFVSLCLKPKSWTHHILAAVACWLATYTLTNGLIAFAAATLTTQAAHGRKLHLNRFVAFWAVNIVAVVVLYLPGLAESGGARPTFLQFTEFFFAYLGSPLTGVLVFPFASMFDIPSQVTVLNAVFGVALVAAVGGAVMYRWSAIRSADTMGLLLICCCAFAMGSAAVTAWGRANFDALGVANANASRYTIFSAYLIYGLIYSFGKPWFNQERVDRYAGMRRVAVPLCLLLFCICTARSYAKSIVVYREAHAFNQTLAAAFLEDDPGSQGAIYPNAGVREHMKTELRRIRMGPYRYSPPEANDLLSQLAASKIADQFKLNGIRTLPAVGRVLFSHPHSRFALAVSPDMHVVRFQFGVSDGALRASPPTDGVEFRIIFQKENGQEAVLWTRTLRPTQSSSDRGAIEDAATWNYSETGKLVFETLSAGSTDTDWAYWKDLVIQRK